jgi:hypothetical protein
LFFYFLSGLLGFTILGFATVFGVFFLASPYFKVWHGLFGTLLGTGMGY